MIYYGATVARARGFLNRGRRARSKRAHCPALAAAGTMRARARAHAITCARGLQIVKLTTRAAAFPMGCARGYILCGAVRLRGQTTIRGQTSIVTFLV